VPPKLTPTIRHPLTPAILNPVLSALLPDEGYAAAHTGYLAGLRVPLDLAIAEVDAEGLLLLRRDVLIAEDCFVSLSPGSIGQKRPLGAL
jgi:hypothetical protein